MPQLLLFAIRYNEYPTIDDEKTQRGQVGEHGRWIDQNKNRRHRKPFRSRSVLRVSARENEFSGWLRHKSKGCKSVEQLSIPQWKQGYVLQAQKEYHSKHWGWFKFLQCFSLFAPSIHHTTYLLQRHPPTTNHSLSAFATTVVLLSQQQLKSIEKEVGVVYRHPIPVTTFFNRIEGYEKERLTVSHTKNSVFVRNTFPNKLCLFLFI